MLSILEDHWARHMFTSIDETGILVVGSSGHASVLVDTIESIGNYKVLGFLDDTLPNHRPTEPPVLGKVADAPAICRQRSIRNIIIAVGDNWLRRKVLSDLSSLCPDLEFPIIKHPSAIVSSSARIGPGTAILAGCHIGPHSRIGDFCIVNTGSSLDHDCIMENFASLAPGVFTGGNVHIGECSAIGVGASISHGICIGSHAVVGTGSVVVRDVRDHVVAYGNPAIVRRSRNEGEPYL